jgi:hypothetical protein
LLSSIKRVIVEKWNNLTFFSQSPINFCWQMPREMAGLSIKWFDTDFKWNNLYRDIYLDIWTYNPKTLRSMYIAKKWKKLILFKHHRFTFWKESFLYTLKWIVSRIDVIFDWSEKRRFFDFCISPIFRKFTEKINRQNTNV